MSSNYDHQAAYYQQASEPPKKNRRGLKIIGAVLGALLILFVGVGIGGASNTAEPEVVVETKTETVTETQTEYIVPDSCIAALDTANNIISNTGYVAEEINTLFGNDGIITILVTAAMEQDSTTLTLGSDMLGDFNDNVNYYLDGMDLTTYTAYHDACINTN